MIYYAFILTRKLSELRKGKSDFAKTIENFQICVAKAQNAIPQLKILADGVQENLKISIEQAASRKAELQFAIKESSEVIFKLENSMTYAKTLANELNTKNINTQNIIPSLPKKIIHKAMLFIINLQRPKSFKLFAQEIEAEDNRSQNNAEEILRAFAQIKNKNQGEKSQDVW
jgi:hypothetical protein